MTEEIPVDASLCICTLKKTASILKKSIDFIGEYLLHLIFIAMIISGIYVGVVIYPQFVPAYTLLVTELSHIPLWVYTIIAAVLALLTYSMSWCICRVITDSDTETLSTAIGLVSGVIIGTFIGWTIGLGLFLQFPETPSFDPVGFKIICPVIGLFWGAFIGSFLGAYRHYKRRVR